MLVVTRCDVFDRYKETGSTGMAILDIGILTGFKLDEKTQDKVRTMSSDGN